MKTKIQATGRTSGEHSRKPGEPKPREPKPGKPGFLHQGFTLIEVALVLVVLGMVMRIAIIPLADLQAHRQRHAAEQQLLQIRQSLFAHVIAYGALPCPVIQNRPFGRHTGMQGTSGINTLARPVGGSSGICEAHQGGVPAHVLGLPGPLSDDRALLDPWGRAYLYTVSSANHAELGDSSRGDWTSAGEASRIGIAELEADLTICAQKTGASCPAAQVRADRLAFVVLSSGSDASGNGSQVENQDMDTEFVLQPESVLTDAPFDDLLVWGSSADVMYHLVRMGWLP